MKFLIAGTGQFASNWVVSKQTAEYENIIGGRKKNFKTQANHINIDWLSLEQIQYFLYRIKPDAVINAVAITDVDLCEEKPELARRVNEIVPLNLALSCEKLDIPLVHLSTDQFSSTESCKRDEKVQPIAVNTYGETKLNAEKNIKLNMKKFIIIRTNFFGYAPEYSITPLMKLMDTIKKGQVYNGATDILFNPVSIDFLIESILKLLKKNFYGLINVSSDTCISKYSFARVLAKYMKEDFSNILPISINKLNLKASRPNFMCLDNSKLKLILHKNNVSLEQQILSIVEDIDTPRLISKHFRKVN